jgi:DNA-directed RNA polymerase subunit RPC12/RpoP
MMTGDDYLESRGTKCPHCGHNVHGIIGARCALGVRYEKMQCYKCQREWEDIYRLFGFQEID